MARQNRLSGRIRQLEKSDLPSFRDHLLRLDPVSRRDRFNGGLGDTFVAAYADRSFSDGTTVIGYVEAGRVRGAAELHDCPDDDEPTGEIAFSVEPQFQGRGIGALLFERLLEHTSEIAISEKHHGPASNRDLNYEASYIIRGLEKLHVDLKPR